MALQPPSSSANRVHLMKKPYRPRRFCRRPAAFGPPSMQRGQSSSSSSTYRSNFSSARSSASANGVELTQHLHALQIALGDLVEVLLHLGREVHVDDVGEVLDEFVGHDLTDVVGEEPAILEPDVAAVLIVEMIDA